MHLPKTRLLLPLLALTSAEAPINAFQDPVPAQEASPTTEPVHEVTVNGEKIFETDVEERFQGQVKQRMRGMQIPAEQMEALRQQATPAILEGLIDEILMSQDMEAAQLTVPDDAYRKFYELSFDAQMMRGPMSRDDIAQSILANEHITYDAYIERESSTRDFRSWVRQNSLIAKRYPKETAVTEDDVKARYERDKATVFTKEPMVTASHILIGFFDGENTDVEKAVDKEMKRAMAEEVLALCQADGADFADLARKHSTGPSGPNGGQLGSFPRTGKMVEPFAKAAFELEVDGISGVVETQFGYHIIKCTGRTEGGVIPLEKVSRPIRQELLLEKIEPQRLAHAKKLRESASIVYPEDPAD